MCRCVLMHRRFLSQEEFDASQYYYHRDDFATKGGLGGGAIGGSLSGANPLSMSAFQSMGGSLLDGDASGAGILRLESCTMGKKQHVY